MFNRDRKQWINSRQACRILKVSEMMVYKYAVLGKLRVLVEPGHNVRFNKDDVEALAIETGAPTDPKVPSAV